MTPSPMRADHQRSNQPSAWVAMAAATLMAARTDTAARSLSGMATSMMRRTRKIGTRMISASRMMTTT